jgi:hypothetical protein
VKEGEGMIAQDVFVMAMNLMDEESEDGTYEGYPSEYKKKAWHILSLLQAELLPTSVAPLSITNENNVLQIDNRSAVTILPYGLAAHLLINEDQGKAAFFNARYDELKRKRPATISKIKDVYGVVPGEQEKPSVEPDIDGGSFLDPDSGVYDGGEW